MARLGDLIEQIRGVSYKPEDVYDKLGENCITLLRANNIKNGQLNFDDVVFVDKKRVHENQLLKAGDILICTSSGSKELVGKAAYVNQDLPMTFGAFCKVVRPQKIRSDYLGHFFNSPNYRQKISNSSAGANINNIRNEHIDELEILLPTEDRQEFVAVVLDKLSNLISLRKQQLAKMDDLVKARFVEMFGDPVHNTKMLPTKSLSDLGALDRGRSKHRPRNAPELLGGPYPLIQTGEVTNAGLYISSYQNTYSELGLQQSKMWKTGTLCITIAANIAQTAILAIDACFPDSVVGFVPYEEVTAIYIHYWFGFFQKILEEQAPQVAQKNINLQILSDLKVMVPPMEAQKEFLVFVKQVEESKLTIQQSLDKLEVMKKLLMQEYFG